MHPFKSFALALTLAATGGAAASACDIVHAYRYQMDDGAYSLALNGVHLRRTTDPGDYSGGGPFNQWLKEGENVLSLTMEQGTADISIIRACATDFDGETLVEASVATGETANLTFFVETAPPAPYANVGALSDDGLADAVAALKAAMEARDFDTFYAMHEGLVMSATAQGFPEQALRGMMSETVADGEASYNDALIYEPVLDGRVWQVMTAEKQYPVVIKLHGGDTMVETGAFWTKIDGRWRVAGN